MSGIVRIELLSKDNFDTWALQIEALLVKADLWEYINGDCVKPPSSDANFQKWTLADKKAKADLILAINPSELKQIKGCETSRDVWLKLQSIYASKGPARKATLLKQLIMHKLEEGNDVKSHINKFFDAVDKLESMDVKIDGDLLSIMLLYSLPSSYENFRCAIESRDNLPTTEALKIKIIEESDARKQTCGNAVIAMSASRHKTFENNKKFDKKKIIKCFKCGVLGHKANECSSKGKGYQKYKNEKQDFFENFYAASAGDLKDIDSSWILDSGCTTHLCKNRNSFIELNETSNAKINLANQSYADVKGQGIVQLPLEDHHFIKLQNTLFVPDLRKNLMSVAKITDQGYQVVFTKDDACIYNSQGKLSFIAKRKGDLYTLSEDVDCCVVEIKTPEYMKWHYRLGHLNENYMRNLMKNGILPNLKISKDDSSINCEICIKGKMAMSKFNNCHKPSDIVLNIIYSDVIGPFRTKSLEGARYVVTFIDDCTRWCEIQFLREKSDVLNAFITYQRSIENRTGKRIKYFQSDNGREYVNNAFDRYLSEQGIARRLTVPHTPQQNGVAERMNRTLLDMGRCLLLQSGLDSRFWSAAIATACHIRNRCPSKSLNFVTPYEKLNGRKPIINYFRVFGSKVMILNKDPTKGKFTPRAINGIFVGYPKECKGYRIWIPSDQKFVVSRDVKFLDEGRNTGSSEELTESSLQLLSHNDENNSRIIEINQEVIKENPTILANNNFNDNQFNDNPDNQFSDNRHLEDNFSNSNGCNILIEKRTRGRPKLIHTGNKGRPRKLFQTVLLRNNTETITENIETNENVETGNENIVTVSEDEEIEQFEMASANFENANALFAGHAEVLINNALKGPNKEEWLNAIESEIMSLLKNDTWKIVKVSDNKNLVGCRFVLTNKYKADGTIERRKARLVAKGYSQKYGIDYHQTFAPVARLETLRLLLALSVRYNFKIWQIDVVTAYLHGNLDEEVLMKIPDMLNIMLKRIHDKQGYKSEIGLRAHKMLADLNNKIGNACLLKKSLYGLKQAGRQWHTKLSTKLKEMGFKSSKNEPCLYFNKLNGDLVLILIYVDDILISTKDEEVVKRIKNDLSQAFEIKDLGVAKYCLGLEINQQGNNIFLSQQGYIKDILKNYGMLDCNPVYTPAEVNLKFDKLQEKPYEGDKYRELIGSLMYLSVATRPDIANIVSKLAQFVNKPLECHWQAAKRVIRYLAGTINKGLLYTKNNNSTIAYTDADWGGCLLDRRSYTGYTFILSGAAISWKSQKQKTVALSSTEVEYMSLAEAAKEALYIRSLLFELGLQELSNIIIHVDNRGAQLLASDSVFHGRTKHVDIRYHFIREAIGSKYFEIKHVPTQQMIADVLTKSISRMNHERCLTGLGLYSNNKLHIERAC